MTVELEGRVPIVAIKNNIESSFIVDIKGNLGGSVGPPLVNAKGELVNFEKIPLLDCVPLHFECDFSVDYRNTVGHELGHGLVALDKGVSVEQFILKPRGNVLGQTKLGGFLPLDSLRIISAAGMVDPTPGLAASGFGGDMGNIIYIDWVQGMAPGATIWSAKNSAESIIRKVPLAVYKKAIDILAYLGQNSPTGEVSGSLLPLIFERAAWEVKAEETGELKEFLKEIRNVKPSEYTTKIIYHKDGSIEVSYYHHQVLCESHTIFPCCGGVDGHSPICHQSPLKV